MGDRQLPVLFLHDSNHPIGMFIASNDAFSQDVLHYIERNGCRLEPVMVDGEMIGLSIITEGATLVRQQDIAQAEGE